MTPAAGSRPTGFRAVFLGAPGAGKGTQAQTLAKVRQILHLSTGDMLRAEVAGGTELGLRAKSFMDAGKLVPDDLIIAMVEGRIGLTSAGKGPITRDWILDGFPRTVPQAEALDRALARAGMALSHVVFFDVPSPVLVRRLSARWTCARCGAIWNTESKPPKQQGVCDHCGGSLKQRTDDRPEAVGQRLEVYERETAPLLDFYQSRNLLRRLDANRSPDVVQHALIQLIQNGAI